MILAAFKGLGISPANAYSQPSNRAPRIASIAANVKNRHLSAFVPSANDDNFDYKWKIFKDGLQVGETANGVNLSSELDTGDYNLQLQVEDKESHQIVSIASVQVHST